MKKLYPLLTLLAVFSLSIQIRAQITGDYNGSAQVRCTTLLEIDETYDGVMVTLEASTPGYCLKITDIELLAGSSLPAFEFCNVTATPIGANYKLTAPPVNHIIPEITIPPLPPFFPDGATLTDVLVTLALRSGMVAGSSLILNMEATAKLGGGLINIPITLDFIGEKKTNSTTGELRMTNDELRIDNVEIYDVFGRKVYDDKNSYGLTVLRSYDLTPFPAGIYFIKITTETGIITKKIVKA